MPSTTSTEEHQPLHPQNRTNYNSQPPSVITVQRAASIGPIRSTSGTLASPPDSHLPTYGSDAVSNSSKAVMSREHRRRSSATHSRSNSVNGVRDGVGNLNRWSQSTTSSKGSIPHARSNSFSRRMSFGGSGSFSIGASTTPSPRKLHKSKPPTSESPSRQTVQAAEPTTKPPFPLHPIITLPALQNDSNARASPSTATTNTPSTAGLLSAAVRAAAGPDYFTTWDDAIPQDFQHSRGQLRGRSPVELFQPSATFSARAYSNSSPSKRQRQERGTSTDRGHSRNRSQLGKTSSGTLSSERSKDRGPKQLSQKAMLSVALQKAHTAVVLDNAQNFEGAMQSYSEACNLLQHVMRRSSGDDDRRKLETIRNTYTARVQELEKIAPMLVDDGKALPARPESAEFRDDVDQSPFDDDEPAIIGTAMVTRIVNDESYVPDPQPRQIMPSQLPERRESLMPSAFNKRSNRMPLSLPGQHSELRTQSRSPMREMPAVANTNLAPLMEREYMPPPLSPRRPLSPVGNPPQVTEEMRRLEIDQSEGPSRAFARNDHQRAPSAESMSWLDMIDGSGDSTASSVHSRTSSLGVRRKHIRAAIGATEAEFDAALDAAVEAAYDEGFEPMDEPDEKNHKMEEEFLHKPTAENLNGTTQAVDYDDEVVANVRRRVEQAKERVRQTARETAIKLAQDRERTRQFQEEREERIRYQSLDTSYDENESEEEERMLDEMTKGYVMDDFEFGLQSKSALPRESDSSGFSGRTWNSSIGSNPTTAGTTLSTVAESLNLPDMPTLLSKPPPPAHPPPALALPRPPTSANSESMHAAGLQSFNGVVSQGVRSRRLSGQNPKQLKIETTTTRMPPIPAAPSRNPSFVHKAPSQMPSTSAAPPSLTVSMSSQSRQTLPGVTARPPVPTTVRQASSPFPGPSPLEVISPPTPTLSKVATKDGDPHSLTPRSGSPARAQSRSGLRKNFSSSSLKNIKSRNLSVSNLDDGSDVSPNTPSNNQFGGSQANKDATMRLPAMPTLPTPIASAFRDKMNGIPMGGLYLFDSDINSPESPGSPGPTKSGAPMPLEPCPTESLLRPFWLMRALYQTLAHPRGGYLSNKLFVPRDVWRIKGVKIKNLEDKIANCDFLTAALQKLAQADTCDADAVLDEMQAFETILEQVQVALTKKLGNDVGIQSSGVLFKDAPPSGDAEPAGSGSKSTGSVSKSASFSWRRLRSKNSAVSLTNNHPNKATVAEGARDGIHISTLPMTSIPTIRFAKRDITQVQFTGPNANYMASLARLFDAAQVIDQIARQVEDPGLRHADKTQVGLELSTRHAAEFFGFYICRFVLADVSLLLDKFIKRGSEWVLV